jgi:hypothetical protein
MGSIDSRGKIPYSGNKAAVQLPFSCRTSRIALKSSLNQAKL